jgi:hypothetical protein
MIGATRMNFRFQADELPETVLKAVGALANKATLRIADVEHRPADQLVTFRIQRLPITGMSFFEGTRHAKTPVSSRITIRNVTDCKIEDDKQCETICIIFGLGFKGHEVFICSAEEDRGNTCFRLTCRASSLDIEIKDE